MLVSGLETVSNSQVKMSTLRKYLLNDGFYLCRSQGLF